jgi:hypothetical protein
MGLLHGELVFSIVGSALEVTRGRTRTARISDYDRGHMLNYLRITKLRAGLIIDYKKPKLEWERLVL